MLFSYLEAHTIRSEYAAAVLCIHPEHGRGVFSRLLANTSFFTKGGTSTQPSPSWTVSVISVCTY